MKRSKLSLDLLSSHISCSDNENIRRKKGMSTCHRCSASSFPNYSILFLFDSIFSTTKNAFQKKRKVCGSGYEGKKCGQHDDRRPPFFHSFIPIFVSCKVKTLTKERRMGCVSHISNIFFSKHGTPLL